MITLELDVRTVASPVPERAAQGQQLFLLHDGIAIGSARARRQSPIVAPESACGVLEGI